MPCLYAAAAGALRLLRLLVPAAVAARKSTTLKP